MVNLLVTPEQAEVLSLASNQTHIQLVLRNPLDTQISETAGTAMGTLFADKTGPPPKRVPAVLRRAAPTPQPQVYVIQVFNGSKKTEQKFGAGEEKQ